MTDETKKDEAIGPALSAEEWGTWQAERYINRGFQCIMLGNNDHACTMFPAGPTRHALAALCLYQQPFGFSQEDVALVRELHNDAELWRASDEQQRIFAARVESLASRIVALLPPQEEK